MVEREKDGKEQELVVVVADPAAEEANEAEWEWERERLRTDRIRAPHRTMRRSTLVRPRPRAPIRPRRVHILHYRPKSPTEGEADAAAVAVAVAVEGGAAGQEAEAGAWTVVVRLEVPAAVVVVAVPTGTAAEGAREATRMERKIRQCRTSKAYKWTPRVDDQRKREFLE